jgi:hypothetical protein
VRPVVLIGGPYDGMTTDVTDDLPYAWRIIVADANRPLVSALRSATEPPAYEYDWKVALYRKVNMQWGADTKVVLYTFEGME